ncbi:zf-HC2 domain-containing protein [Bacillus nakamurai]|uniref:Anti-sigma factor n=1 Tax=Bacillus nakamurai TaxID=1793963 RepID=A0A150F9X3_9BACI|nr:zf-HC2 domain-containing protein [Bacillus nakamurai]KXZ22032.1 anti-sigma factor [Bacillus nakamurai]MED1228760.1 zf-HC2 domain-containing protein [Bacillus nakamurai]
MTCCLVRDLLPLYIEGDCQKETERFMARHLEECEECGELYRLMKEPLELGAVRITEQAWYEEEESRFRQKYYGVMLTKAACLFGAVFMIMLLVNLLL